MKNLLQVLFISGLASVLITGIFIQAQLYGIAISFGALSVVLLFSAAVNSDHIN